MEGVDVPSYFLCPISLEIMRDPVTLFTGITYDRDAIERWLFSEKHKTCPVTKQSLSADHCGDDIIPNHTLRRLIQAWCVANAANGVERFPTPRPPVDKAHIAMLLEEAKSPQFRIEALGKLKKIVSGSDRNKRCIESSDFLEFLATIISKSEDSAFEEEALSILYSLQLSEEGLLRLMKMDEDFIESLTTILHRSSNYQSRVYATLLIKSLIKVLAPVRLVGLKEEIFEEIVNVLRDRISYQATKAALQVLKGLCPWGRNRIKAANAGSVSVLIELLLEEHEKRTAEMMLVVLDQLCRCVEGRLEIVGHAAGIPVVSKRIFRVSEVASEMAVRILHSILKFSATPAVLQEMLQVGVVSKLCMLLKKRDYGIKIREKVEEMLWLHSRAWRHSPCISPHLQASYPSS